MGHKHPSAAVSVKPQGIQGITAHDTTQQITAQHSIAQGVGGGGAEGRTGFQLASRGVAAHSKRGSQHRGGSSSGGCTSSLSRFFTSSDFQFPRFFESCMLTSLCSLPGAAAGRCPTCCQSPAHKSAKDGTGRYSESSDLRRAEAAGRSKVPRPVKRGWRRRPALCSTVFSPLTECVSRRDSFHEKGCGDKNSVGIARGKVLGNKGRRSAYFTTSEASHGNDHRALLLPTVFLWRSPSSEPNPMYTAVDSLSRFESKQRNPISGCEPSALRASSQNARTAEPPLPASYSRISQPCCSCRTGTRLLDQSQAGYSL